MREDRYLEYFGFAERSFTLLPDSDIMFWSGRYGCACSAPEFGLATDAPLAGVTGTVDTGRVALLPDVDENAGNYMRELMKDGIILVPRSELLGVSASCFVSASEAAE